MEKKTRMSELCLNGLTPALYFPCKSFEVWLSTPCDELLCHSSRHTITMLDIMHQGTLLDELTSMHLNQVAQIGQLKVMLAHWDQEDLCGHQLPFIPTLQKSTERLLKSINITTTALAKTLQILEGHMSALLAAHEIICVDPQSTCNIKHLEQLISRLRKLIHAVFPSRTDMIILPFHVPPPTEFRMTNLCEEKMKISNSDSSISEENDHFKVLTPIRQTTVPHTPRTGLEEIPVIDEGSVLTPQPWIEQVKRDHIADYMRYG